MSAPGRIRRLADDLVNKIAAGEVVERPASVVKELVENALDAGASRVVIAIEDGGRALIRVGDDGSGMAAVDAELALERHATSKLSRLADLQAIVTHGFRGEALPSIASVSHLVLRTAEEGAREGTEVEVRHGRREQARAAGHPRGTTVEVRDLFGAVPARRKFLRSAATETGHVAETVTLQALSRPDVGFFLESNGRPLIRASPASSLRDRAFQLFGAGWLDEVVPVDGGHEWAGVEGYVSRPDRSPASRARVRLFTNRRPVRDRGLAKAVTEAYRTAGAEGRLSEAVLFVEAPVHLVDVNVHPAKSEVRFADIGIVFRAVEAAVRDALSKGARKAPPRVVVEEVREAVESYLASPTAAQLALEAMPASAKGSLPPGEVSVRPVEHRATVLGQHRNTYIVASDGEEIALYDQHTSHERVRFETQIAAVDRGAVPSQRLLHPLVLTLPPLLLPLVEEHAAVLQQLGYDVELFGGTSARIRAVPELVGRKDPAGELTALLEDFRDRDRGEWIVTGPLQRLAATLSCHSAVRAGDSLSVPSMQAIVDGLARTRHPTLCPHGRPTVVRIPKDEVTRWFERVGWRRR